MKFNVTSPCQGCPFRKVGFTSLDVMRVIEIATAAVGPQGGSFLCHETVDPDDDGEPISDDTKVSHCAGELIFAEKDNNPTQLMRICERIGLYDRRKLTGQDKVFDDLASMLDAHVNAQTQERKR